MPSDFLFCVPKTGRSDSFGHELCKKYNDGGGCVAESHCRKSHVCDVLTDKYTICGATDHSRYFHDGDIYGWLKAFRPDLDAQAFWEYHGSPDPDAPGRRDPAPNRRAAPEIDDEESSEYWTKAHFDSLYYWDRNLNSILWDAAQKASDSQILKCPADDCPWAFKLFSKSSVPPESASRQHIESKVDDQGTPIGSSCS